MGKRSGWSAHGNRPPSTMAPPRVVTWPPTNLVSEWTTTSAPCSRGLSISGVATVLSTMRGTPAAWATAATASRSTMLPAGLPMVSQKTARVLSSMRGAMDSARASAGRRAGEEGEGGPVERGGHHDVRADTGHRQDGVADGGHARSHHQGRRPPFEGADALLEDVAGRVVEPVVVEAGRLQVEHGTGVGGVDEVVGHRLVDRYGHGPRPVGCVATVDGDGLVVHGLTRSSSRWCRTGWRTGAGPRRATARGRGHRPRRRGRRPPGPGPAHRPLSARAAGGACPSPGRSRSRGGGRVVGRARGRRSVARPVRTRARGSRGRTREGPEQIAPRTG